MVRFLFIILFLTSPFKAYPLQHFEELPTKLLKVFKGNIVVLDRGREDEVQLKDHIKLVTIPEGFSSRAIAVKTTPKTSHWKLFRIVNPEKISKDLNYKIISLNPAPLPPSYRYLSNNDYIAAYLRRRKKDLSKIINSDQPKSFAINQELLDEPEFYKYVTARKKNQNKGFFSKIWNFFF